MENRWHPLRHSKVSTTSFKFAIGVKHDQLLKSAIKSDTYKSNQTLCPLRQRKLQGLPFTAEGSVKLFHAHKLRAHSMYNQVLLTPSPAAVPAVLRPVHVPTTPPVGQQWLGRWMVVK